jgi:glycosyltransferase involved in cell wall biosynthesis
VAASRAGSLPEVGGDAAVYAPPDDAAAWAAALRRIVDDAALRQRLVAAGIERAAGFTWERSAERHVEVFRAVAR